MARVTVVHRRPRPCTRCGAAPRHGDTYLCAECLVDPVTHEMADAALAADRDHARLLLIQSGWKGGWPRKDMPVHV